MSYKDVINSVPEKPGIYIFFDFDGTALYVGRSKRLRGRLTEHFVRFNSSIIADSNLDPRDVASIKYWILPNETTARSLEGPFLAKYQPRYNLGDPDLKAKEQSFDVLLPAEAEAITITLNLPEYSRNAPLARIKNKAHLIHEMILKFELAGVTPKGERVLLAHCEELLSIAKKVSVQNPP